FGRLDPGQLGCWRPRNRLAASRRTCVVAVFANDTRANCAYRSLCKDVGTLVSRFPMSMLSPSAVPADLTAITDALDGGDQNAGGLVADLDHDQFNWQPATGGWSIAQCLDHLTRANGVYLDALRAGAADARTAQFVRRGPIRPGILSRLFIRVIGPRT